METVIKSVVGSLTTLIIGYLIGVLKKAKQKNKDTEENNNLQNEAIMTMLQSNLTNTYFAYSTLKKIPDYIYQNWINELRVYEKLGGNSFIHVLAKKMEQFEITHTDILK